ncbi:MAG: ATP phosphoribosyltransferase regulatory subunit [Candidatus Margulisbacteria bacterium]|nr:ATP phosphoribosyltransferase regulatory subunit [Candidatus Margulisiibacteriota bacterium]
MKGQTPKGVRDLLPEEMAKQARVIGKIRQIFEAQGYQRIATPTFELYDVLKIGLTPKLQEKTFKFLDKSGRLMALRPDMTTPIARVVATQMKNVKGPIRLYYSDNVYRQQKLEAGQDNQFYQLGVELIGASGKNADEEIIKICRKALEIVGLKDVRIDVTNVSKIKSMPLAKQEALASQNYVKFGRLPKKDELVEVDIDYYTGMVFECYVPQLGYPLGVGGRYDNLLGKYGKKMPAVGFALGLGRILLALDLQKKNN